MSETWPAPQCLIFDLDGTLVDSESLCNQAFLDLLPGLQDSVAVLTERYRGQKLASILVDLAARLEAPLSADFELRYRSRVAELFETQLKPMPGASMLLQNLPLPFCIASGGPLPKIRQALEVSGLAPYVGETRVFSSYSVGAWKPDPGLFLHAAAAMGFEPAACVVVEDSAVGVQAAQAAGMQALWLTQDSAAAQTSVTPIHRLSQVMAWLGH
ncbi:HAD-IA family hydrolase [Ideonella sp.]|jgi:HAD superfamily hydrolase (TIGR01509 family)|uniref:HAD-IA family hydrolase n=1 Tax=Ideonella sp. TaxID=1929293 RepID=UPI0037C11730